MMTVNEVSRLTGVSIRALHYYDEIGLLVPTVTTEAGYRLYNDDSLRRLQQILLFRELEFPLKDIRTIMDSPDFDRVRALDRQIGLLRLRRERMDALIAMAEKMKETGDIDMSFRAFDKRKMKQYEADARKEWGNTAAWKEYEEKSAGLTDEGKKQTAEQLMALFAEFGAMREKDPADEAVQAHVRRLQDFISAHYYHCTDEILASLGTMYSAGGEMTENIDAAGGTGTAAFAAKAIAVFCR